MRDHICLLKTCLQAKACAPIAKILAVWISALAVWPAGARSTSFQSGDLQLTLSNSTQGIAVEGLLDSARTQELLATNARPLFTITLRQEGGSNEIALRADAGWSDCALTAGSRRMDLRWSEPANAALKGLSVKATARRDAPNSAIRWKLSIENRTTNWTVWRVVFPDLALADLGSNACAFFPRGPGEVQANVWARPFSYHGNYPGGWCAMQFMAAYRENDSGLYVAMHDPWGSTKDLVLQSEPKTRSLRIAFEHPAPDMGLAGNSFALEGEAIWQLLRGDWFDAAMIYKHWAQREAKWWPRLGRDGRGDTPRWMRELNAWAMTGGAPGACVDRVREFRTYLGLPIGFHWYNWHQIPFDNDYPHYFPPKEGFARGVAELKSAGVFPMPYINGRLWDTHDRVAQDFEFTSRALRAVTKKEDGSPWIETYGSKETNGEPVRLGVMCPTTALWRNTVSNIVLRLLDKCGTSGVYIDQVAAAAPKLCMDRSHGHPLGGGHWWTEAYWKMLADIRRAMPPETMLTTECNGEPFIRWFDGYLTWHWQFDGQVPAFPAVYGGAIQMFGRAYRGGATKDLALRMKAGQQLVFGEQLGWLDPNLVKEKKNAEFFRKLAQLRSKFSRYFYAGEMARPPQLSGDVPKVKADWQWSGEWWVTTDAVLAGAWRLPREGRLLLLFVNVSDAPVSAQVANHPDEWGLRDSAARCRRTTSGNRSEGSRAADSALPQEFPGWQEPITFPLREAQAWEFY